MKICIIKQNNHHIHFWGHNEYSQEYRASKCAPAHELGTTAPCWRISYSPASAFFGFRDCKPKAQVDLRNPSMKTCPLTPPEFPPSHWDVFHQNTQLAISTDDACTIAHSPWFGVRMLRTNQLLLPPPLLQKMELGPCLPWPNLLACITINRLEVLARSGRVPNNPRGLATFRWLRWRGSSSVLS